MGTYELYKLDYKYRSNGLGVDLDLERLRFPSLCGQDVSLVGVPAGLLPVLAAVSSGGFAGGRVMLHLWVTEFRHSHTQLEKIQRDEVKPPRGAPPVAGCPDNAWGETVKGARPHDTVSQLCLASGPWLVSLAPPRVMQR